MKRRDLLKTLEQIAKDKGEQITTQEGGNHTKVTIGSWSQPIPRHREINELLAKSIIRKAKQ